MKTTCWLLCLVMGLHSVAIAQVGTLDPPPGSTNPPPGTTNPPPGTSGPPSEFPPPPIPPPISVPNCPISLMGIVGGVHYWVTASCPLPNPGPTGYGQSMGPLQTGCNGGSCYSPVVLIIQQEASADTGSVELKARELPEGTQVERNTKLDEILKEVKKLEKYLKKVAKSPDIGVDHKARLNAWTSYLPTLVKYLEDKSPSPPADSVEKKIANYKDKVVVAFENDNAEWRRPKLKLTKGTARHRDEQQTEAPVAADAVRIEEQPGFEIIPEKDASGKEVCFEVDVNDLAAGASKKVYFRPYKIRSKTDPDVYTQIGIQVLGPGKLKIKKVKMGDRNAFAHRLVDVNTPYLVQSYDDLSIE